YAGRLWHVQTEDSGVQNPHIFTHLFEGGTILATKRTDYDATSDVAVVQKLMQTQHKAMLRDLKAGAFDEKISKFLGVPIAKEDRAPEEITDKQEGVVLEMEADSEYEHEVPVSVLSPPVEEAQPIELTRPIEIAPPVEFATTPAHLAHAATA